MTKRFLTCVLSLALLLTPVTSAAQPHETTSASLLPPPETAGIPAASAGRQVAVPEGIRQGEYQITRPEQAPNRVRFPRAGGGGGIHTGGPISSWFAISPVDVSDLGESNPAVAYNRWWDEYLVVWVKEDASGGDFIYGRFVADDGVLIGPRFLIPGFSGSCGAPDVAYNSARSEYLVVCDFSSPSGYGIYGQRLDPYGTALGTQLTFASSTTDPYREPAVAYATTSGTYLVVWQRNQGSVYRGIEARTLSGDGATMGSILEVTGLLVDVAPSVPDVAYTPTLDECLVVWQQWYDSSYTDHDIKGQRIHMEGGAHLVTPPGNFLIHYSSYDEVAPHVASIARTTGIGQYLVVCAYNWTDSGTWIAAGRTLTDAGVLDRWLPIGTSSGVSPAVAGNDATQEYLVAWPTSSSTGVQARTVSTLGDMGATAEAQPARSGSSPMAPGVASGPPGSYLVTCHDFYQAGYAVDVLGYLWGHQVFLPLVVR